MLLSAFTCLPVLHATSVLQCVLLPVPATGASHRCQPRLFSIILFLPYIYLAGAANETSRQTFSHSPIFLVCGFLRAPQSRELTVDYKALQTALINVMHLYPSHEAGKFLNYTPRNCNWYFLFCLLHLFLLPIFLNSVPILHIKSRETIVDLL